MDDASTSQPPFRTRKKPSLPVTTELRDYLKKFRRERDLPVTYERLRHFHESHSLMDSAGRNTLWESVAYQAEEIPALNEDLKRIYALLRVDGDFSVMQHLYIDRVDFCSFGNSTPFRIRIAVPRRVSGRTPAALHPPFVGASLGGTSEPVVRRPELS